MSVRPEGPRPEQAAAATATVRSDPAARHYWLRAGLRIALLCAAAAAAGYFTGHLAGSVIAMLVLVLIVQIRNLVALRVWLHHPKRNALPERGGVWGEVFDGLLDLQRKNRKKKKKLAAMLAEFQASTAALPDGAVVLGERGEIYWFNAAARTLLGLRVSQDSGIRIANLIRHPAFTAYIDKGDYSREVEVPSPINRSRTLALRIIPYGGNQKLLIARDVSERLLLDAARRDFVANASHELRTPLTVLRGYLDMMEVEAQGTGVLAPWASPIGEMRNQALRMEALVGDMLKLARLEAGRALMQEGPLDAAAMVERAVEDARQLSKGQHRFEVDVESGLGLIGGETELRSVFTNLASNAVRYTPPGGVIRVSWRSGPEGARYEVADSGIGIAQEDVPRLTERFYRVDVGRSRASGGTGLGLSIVKHALESFDSQLDVQSELGVGSTFSCIFPPHRVTRVARESQPARNQVG